MPTLTKFITLILVWSQAHLDAVESPHRQIIEELQPVMCTHDAEKLAISVLEIYEAGFRGERSTRQWGRTVFLCQFKLGYGT